MLGASRHTCPADKSHPGARRLVARLRGVAAPGREEAHVGQSGMVEAGGGKGGSLRAPGKPGPSWAGEVHPHRHSSGQGKAGHAMAQGKPV